MAKFFLIIVCVCYCTACAHLVAAHLTQKDLSYKLNGIASTINQQKLPDEYKDQQSNVLKNAYDSSTSTSSNLVNINENNKYPTQYFDNIDDSDGKNELELNLAHKQIHTKRVKRHAGHSHGSTVDLGSLVEMNPNTRHYIRQLFRQFGKNDETITLNEFEVMIKQLGLQRYLFDEQINSGNNPSRSKDTVDNENGNEPIDSHNNETVNI